MDDRGRRLATAPARVRVVSLVPSLTEIVVELGGASQLVGRTRFDEDPRIEHVRSVGGTVDPDLETILDAEPDLVITWAESDARALSDRLESFDVPVYAGRTRSIADFERHTRALGALLGRGAAADSLTRRVARRLGAVRAPEPVADPPTILFVVWPRPLMTSGRHTFVDELIRLVGARGAFDDVPEPWPIVSPEAVLERDPDVIVIASEQAQRGVPAWVLQDPVWRTLDAVREGHVHVVDADVFNRPGPRMVLAASELARYVRALSDDR